MKNRLSSMYELQLIDDQLDELEALRGDLPAMVSELEDKLRNIQNQINGKEEESAISVTRREQNIQKIEKLHESQKRFKSQLYQVRTNKEYDALTKEIDAADAEISRLEKENDALVELSDKLKAEAAELQPVLAELQDELKHKNENLAKIVKSNETEFKKLMEKRKAVEAKINKGDYDNYMRIRKARRGKAVATIRRSACSGCNSIVPSQRQLEIRRNNRIYTCEACGRMLVSAEIADELSAQTE